MKLTILLGFYNAEPHALVEAVACLLKQDDGVAHDILLLDDGSTDMDTRAAAAALGLRPNIRMVRFDENRGLAAVLNDGHRMADTDYIALMGDDVCSPSRLRLQCDYLKKRPETDVLGTQLFSFWDDDIARKPIITTNHPELVVAKENNWLVNHGTVVYRKSAVQAVGGYDESLRRTQDVDLWGRMFNAGYVFRNLPQVLYGWRKFK